MSLIKAAGLNDCDACHVVAKDQPVVPLVAQQAPNFFDIAKRANTTAESPQSF